MNPTRVLTTNWFYLSHTVGMINLIKDLLRSIYFLCSIQFLRMALLWTFSVAFSHYQLFKDSLFSHKIVSYPRSSPSTFPNKPVCVITGVSSFFFLPSLANFIITMWILSFFLCRQHQAWDYLLHASFLRKDMLLLLVILYSFC